MVFFDAARVLIPFVISFAVGIATAPILTYYLYKHHAWKKKGGKVKEWIEKVRGNHSEKMANLQLAILNALEKNGEKVDLAEFWLVDQYSVQIEKQFFPGMTDAEFKAKLKTNLD